MHVPVVFWHLLKSADIYWRLATSLTLKYCRDDHHPVLCCKILKLLLILSVYNDFIKATATYTLTMHTTDLCHSSHFGRNIWVNKRA